MARIRTVKPEFWTDERVGECSVSARLLLIASLNFADDYGGLERSAKQLKAQAFPYDAIDCEPLVLELIEHGLLIEYEVADRKYLHIKGFQKHQKVENRARPRIPLYDDSLKCHRVLTETSPRPHLGVADSSLEGIKEGNGKEHQPPIPPFDPSSIIGLDLEQWQQWVSYRKKRKPPIKRFSMEAAAKELAAFGEQQAAVVKHSIANGYQGLIQPKGQGPPPSVPYHRKTSAELEAEGR